MDIHILGLGIDPRHGILTTRLKGIAASREAQKKETISKIKSMGYDITFEEVKAKAKGSIGRPHIAKALSEKYPQEFPSLQSVFDRLIGNDKPAYVDRRIGFSLQEAVSLIHSACGVAFLAHPLVYKYDIDQLIADFEYADGDGIEVYYDYKTNRPENQLTETQNEDLIAHAHALAAVGGFIMSGGSDFHGESKGQRIGAFGAPDELLNKIKAATQ
jgi:predicted metal-dependent phosphoesterase TrpH